MMLAVMAVGLAHETRPGKEAAGPWLTDHAQARALATRTGKPIFVVFRCPH
jgi:hypothetical protein